MQRHVDHWPSTKSHTNKQRKPVEPGGGGGADGVYDANVCPQTPTDGRNYGDRVPVDTTPGQEPDVQDPQKEPLLRPRTP